MALSTPVLVIGGSTGGTSFSHYGGTNGKILEKIGVWAAKSRIKAIMVRLTDEAPRTIGDTGIPAGEGPLRYQEFTFQPAELIARLSLWGNGQGTRSGWIYFETNQNRRFDWGMYEWPKQQEFPVDVASGICVGVMGRAAADIDALGFVFLNPIADSKLVSVQYPTLSFEAGGIAPQTLEEFNYTNINSSVQSWEFSGAMEVTISSAWSVTTGLSVHATVSVKASIPLVGQVSGEFGWELSASSTFGTTTSSTDTLTWKVAVSAIPGESVNLRAVAGRGTISLPYTGFIEVSLKNGTKFQYPLQGQYSGVSYSGVTIT